MAVPAAAPPLPSDEQRTFVEPGMPHAAIDQPRKPFNFVGASPFMIRMPLDRGVDNRCRCPQGLSTVAAEVTADGVGGCEPSEPKAVGM